MGRYRCHRRTDREDVWYVYGEWNVHSGYIGLLCSYTP